MASTGQNLFQDFSGVASSSKDPNPYNALIDACDNDPTQIKGRYELHRSARSKQQRANLLSPDFQGVNPEVILRSLLDEEARPADQKTGYVDPRHCLVFWARPPERVRHLVGVVQERLKAVVPNMWFMPLPNLHLTALEIAHSLTPSALAALKADSASLVIPATDILHTLSTNNTTASGETATINGINEENEAPRRKRTVRLSSPMVTFDASAVALSFLPSDEDREDGSDERYTYHYLRRDMWDLCSSTSAARAGASAGGGAGTGGNGGIGKGVPIASRYVVPSCHLTVGRFVSRTDTSVGGDESAGSDPERMRAFVQAIDGINEWLEKEYWGKSVVHANGSAAGSDGGQRHGGKSASLNPGVWTVGEEVGLELRSGTVWYGGGERVRVGRGIEG